MKRLYEHLLIPAVYAMIFLSFPYNFIVGGALCLPFVITTFLTKKNKTDDNSQE